MKFFVKAIVYGFALSLGGALFKKVQSKLGLGEDKASDRGNTATDVTAREGASDPGLQHEFS